MAAAMGIELLTEEQYRELQKLGNFDTKTSSWVKTPSEIRKLGGALFCDRIVPLGFPIQAYCVLSVAGHVKSRPLASHGTP
jgi:uncharacterized protein DUF4256